MQRTSSILSHRRADQGRLRQDAYEKRSRAAMSWVRRGLFVMGLAVLAVAWQDPTLGPIMQQAAADAADMVDAALGGDGNAREIVIAALSDIRS